MIGKGNQGFSLLELLLTLSLLALLATLAVPAMQGLVDRQRLRVTTETLAAELRAASRAAMRLDRPVLGRFDISTPDRWCLALSDRADCPCDDADCSLGGRNAGLNSDRLPGVRLGTSFPRHRLRFGPLRGGARPGTIYLQAGHTEARIVISSLGRIRVCGRRLGDYPPC